MKQMTLLVVLLCGVLGCGGGAEIVPVVHAAAASTLGLNCPAAAVLIDKPGVLKVGWGPCNYTATGSNPIAAEDSSVITLSRPINAKFVESWIGTNAKSMEEVGIELTVELPDGRERYFPDEFDKDTTSIAGEQWHKWQIDLNLPVGTVLRLHSKSGVTNPSTDCPLGCAQDVVWLLEDGIE
jgi:hypothetical protein